MAYRKYKSVTRVDSRSGKTHAWWVRVAFQGQMHSKMFSDSLHGGRRKALDAAVKWRNKTERELGKPRTERTVIALSPRNRTGVPGIRRTLKPMTRDGRKKGPVYEVVWQAAPGELHRTCVSITKHGEAQAFRLAYRLRKAKEREMYGSELPIPRQSRRKVLSKLAAARRDKSSRKAARH